MAEIVNLRRVKKQQARQEAAQVAAQNRIRHGRIKAERVRDEAERERERKRLDGVKRE